jgi:hypothetical protein
MAEWLDPGTWESIAKTAATSLAAWAKLRAAMARRRKATRPADTRALDKEIDALQADLQQLVDLLTKQAVSHGEFLQAVVNLLGPMDAPDGEKGVDRVIQHVILLRAGLNATQQLQEIVLTHEHRLKALEGAPKDHPGDRVPKLKQRRRPRKSLP